MREPNVLDVIGLFCNICFYIVAPIGCAIGMGALLLSVVGLI